MIHNPLFLQSCACLIRCEFWWMTPPSKPRFFIGASFYLPKKHLTFRIWNIVVKQPWWILYARRLSQQFLPDLPFLHPHPPFLSFIPLSLPLSLSVFLPCFPPSVCSTYLYFFAGKGCLVGHLNVFSCPQESTAYRAHLPFVSSL